MPMLLENRAFRQHIASNIKINSEVAEFWLERFERLSKRDREEQVESTLNRLNAVL
jgi:G:T-mismatch repair DNA endonuclease (very short patch repair protein)